MARRDGRRGHAILACPETAAGQDAIMASFPLRWRRLQVATAHASQTVYVVTLRWARTSSSHSAHALYTSHRAAVGRRRHHRRSEAIGLDRPEIRLD